MFFRKVISVCAVTCVLATSAYAGPREQPRDPFQRFVRFIQAHLPSWMHAHAFDDYPTGPKP